MKRLIILFPATQIQYKVSSFSPQSMQIKQIALNLGSNFDYYVAVKYKVILKPYLINVYNVRRLLERMTERRRVNFFATVSERFTNYNFFVMKLSNIKQNSDK